MAATSAVGGPVSVGGGVAEGLLGATADAKTVGKGPPTGRVYRPAGTTFSFITKAVLQGLTSQGRSVAGRAGGGTEDGCGLRRGRLACRSDDGRAATTVQRSSIARGIDETVKKFLSFLGSYKK